MAGIPSKGVAQVIDPTFQSYKDPGFDDIWQAEDNIRASLNYLLRDPKFGGQGVAALTGAGYDQGGIFKHGTFGINMSGLPEAVFTNAEWKKIDGLVKKIPNLTDESTPEGAFAAKRMGDYGKTMSKIRENSLLEILGLEDTPLNPEHRYRKFKLETANATGAAPGINAGLPEYGTNMPFTSENVVTTPSAPTTGPPDVTNINLYVSSVDEAFAKAKTFAAQKALQFTGRW
ncbi:lysozyme family protein [Rhodococcus erythropolis]